MDFKKIISKLPNDFSLHTKRDISIFTSSVFAETYVETMNKIFNINFSAVLWITRSRNNTSFYRSQKEHDRFRIIIGKKLFSKRFQKKICKKYIKLCDWILNFINQYQTKKEFFKKRKLFIKKYKEFFAYHQAIYWGGDFLHKNFQTMKKTIDELTDAYAYGERIVPHVEKYLVKRNSDNYIHKFKHPTMTDIGICFLKPKKQTRFMLFYYEFLQETENYLQKKEKVFFNNINEVKGIGINKKIVTGTVFLAHKFDDLIKVPKNSILVTFMTRPSYNGIISKCKAIVTDEGAILSHPAILAREQGIPCVVGTKFATKIFQTGNRIEVNSETGVVRKV